MRVIARNHASSLDLEFPAGEATVHLTGYFEADELDEARSRSFSWTGQVPERRQKTQTYSGFRGLKKRAWLRLAG